MRPAAPGHLDPFDAPERLGRPFTVSLVVHGALVVALFLGLPMFKKTTTPFMGDPNVGAGVAVTPVKTIPILQKQGQVNHLANDTDSMVPQEPLKLKEQRAPQPKVPEKAIELPSKTQPKPLPRQSNPVQYRPREQYQKNQVFTRTPQALKSDQVGIQGGGGVGIAPNSIFGYQFGAYAQQIRDLIASKWNQSGVSASPDARAIISIRIQRNGEVSVSTMQTSGSYTLDTSARRAILDANPLPPLPPGFPRSEADVDLQFQLRR